MFQQKPNFELYYASHVLLSERWLGLQLRLFVHEYLALTEFRQEIAANHADIVLERALIPSDTSFGKLSKRIRNNFSCQLSNGNRSPRGA